MISGRSHRVGFLAPLAFSLLVAGSVPHFTGCSGDPGPAGSNAPDYDHHPPEIRLLHPASTTELIGDTLTLLADATDEGGEVVRVEFLVNGNSTIGGDSAVLFEPPYQFLWDFGQSQTPYGFVSFQALATDQGGNQQATPLFLLNRRLYTGIDTLSYFISSAEAESPWPIPDSVIVFDTNGDSIDMAFHDQIGTRFTSLAQGDLLSVGFFFEEIAGITPPNQLQVVLHRFDASLRPRTSLFSTLVAFSETDIGQWWDVDLSQLDAGQPFRLLAGESILIVVHLEEGAFGPSTGVGLAYSAQSISSETPALERGWMHTSSLGWETIGEHYPGAGEYRPKMRAVVEYDTPSR